MKEKWKPRSVLKRNPKKMLKNPSALLRPPSSVLSVTWNRRGKAAVRRGLTLLLTTGSPRRGRLPNRRESTKRKVIREGLKGGGARQE